MKNKDENMKMKDENSFIRELNHRSEEERKHHISEDDLKGAYILGRSLKDKTSQMVNSKLKFRFSPEIYDEEISTLKIFGVEVKVPHGRNQDYLCRVIFLKYQNKLDDLERKEKAKAKQGLKEWGWDEIFEMSDGLICPRDEEMLENKRWRVMYNAAKAVNDLIEKKTQAKDFFLTKPIKMVKINPIYLL